MICSKTLFLTVGIVIQNTYCQFTDKFVPLGGVVSNCPKCADIGSIILAKGGTAVDAAIATLFCEGVTIPHIVGIGGGFIMTVYKKSTKTAEVLIARETAPAASNTTMFQGNSKLAFKGAMSVAVPGELMGYWYAHERYGKLAWKTLIKPTIKLCRRGHLVSKLLANVFLVEKRQLQKDVGLRWYTKIGI